jgi:hypothetical protein
MSDIADKIYAATGLTLSAEAAAKIGQMIQQARRDGREEAARRILTYFNNNDIAQNAAAAIRSLGEKE